MTKRKTLTLSILLLGLIVLMPALTRAESGEDQNIQNIQFNDNGAALVNPGMGWVMHFYSNNLKNYGSKLAPSDTVDDFPGLSTIYLRLPWSILEPKEGEFNWSVVDTPAQRWIDKGLRIAFRISCCESGLRYATPKWVEEAGAKGYNCTPRKGIQPDGQMWEPEYNDPVFLAKLDAFLAAMARRYNGNPSVAFIDVGSYGVWGEGHTSWSSKIQVTDEVKLKHIDLYLKHFPDTLLAVTDDYIGNAKQWGPINDYMLEKGIALRDDSICVQPPPHSWHHAEMAGSFWKKLPVILEHHHYGDSVARGAWKDGTLLIQAVEEYHASYLSIHWWPHEFLEKNRKTIDAINRRLGYRIQLREASWPKEVPLGGTLEMITTWANAGVAPCLPGGYPALTLKDDQDGIVFVRVDEQFNVRNLKTAKPGKAPTKTSCITFRIAEKPNGLPDRFLHKVPPGDYEVFLSIGHSDGTPKIALPLPDDDGHHRYPIGQIKITAQK